MKESQQPALDGSTSELLVSQNELKRLQGLPRLINTTTQLWGRSLEITDPYWYVHCYRELYENEIYRFNADRPDPLIIDCGANIGMSVLYFKYLYPDARVIAFEPDPNIFAVLQRNVTAYELSDVELHRNAVWNAQKTLRFAADGSVGGKLVDGGDDDAFLEVECVRLRDYLRRPVDFLKLDIEGAEYEVLIDCAPVLTNVRYLFVEYHGSRFQDQFLHQLLEILDTAGFRYHAKEAWPVSHPFIEEDRPFPYDLQLNIFAFRNWNDTRASSMKGIASFAPRLAKRMKRIVRPNSIAPRIGLQTGLALNHLLSGE